MGGIYTTTTNITTIDEALMVYKDTEEIKSIITDTVDVIKTIKNYKFIILLIVNFASFVHISTHKF